VTTARAGDAAEAGGIGLRPAHVDPNDPATRAYFKPTVAPGGTFSDQVVVSNTSAAAVDLIVSGVDGLTAETSGAVYANRDAPVGRTGGWVTPAATTLTVAPRSEATMGFTVRVPASAVPGDHLAGIAFENAHPTTSGGEFAVKQVVRAVMGVQVRVPGPAGFHVHIDRVRLRALPGTALASVVVTIGNDGRLLGKPELSVALAGPAGYRRTVDRKLDTILPGDTIAFPFAWPDTLKPGRYTITVTARGDGSTASLHASDRLAAALAGVPASGTQQQAPAHSKGSGSTFPTWVLAVVALAGIVGGVLIGRRGRGGRPAVVSGSAEERPALSREEREDLHADR
jgi:hypothetical protein